jgi:hypothetical protein
VEHATVSEEEDRKVIRLVPPKDEPERTYTMEDHYKNLFEQERSLRKILSGLMLFIIIVMFVGGMILGRVADDHTAAARVEEQAACDLRVEEETGRTYSRVCSGEQQCPTTPTLSRK